MKKSSITSTIFKRAISTNIFDKKDPKRDKIFSGLLPLQKLLPNDNYFPINNFYQIITKMFGL